MTAPAPAEYYDDPRAQYRESLVSKLNEHQSLAVTWPYESVLVLAGAGSGKTSVLTARIAFLINDGVHPGNIMAVTFTNKAAEEMRKRLRKIMGKDEVNAIWVGTFHSICNRLLRTEHEAAGLPKNFAILDMDGQEVLLRSIIKDANLAGTDTDEDDSVSKEDKITPRNVAGYINKNKEFGVWPSDLNADASSREGVMIELYKLYQQSCQQQGLLDFNDLLYKAVALLEGSNLIRQTYQTKFQSILVDEFQDTNDIQYRFLNLLKGPHSFIMAVGDDDQSIYGFRGANPANMQRFVHEVAQSNVIKLERNYRSLPYILESANAVIGRNANRLGKDLWTDAEDSGEKILCTEFGSGYLEAKSIAKEIHRLVREDDVPPSEVAVLYRTNSQSRAIEQELNKLGIPLTVYGGYRFYERQEIKNVLSYLDLACSVDRDISFARVVNFPRRGIGERTVEDLRQEAKERNASMMEMIGIRADEADKGLRTMTSATSRQQVALESFASMILDMVDAAQQVPLSELIETVIVNAGIKQHYLSGTKKSEQDEAEERMSNLGELVSAAKQFEIDHSELKTAAEQLPEYLSFVQLMTSTSEADMDKKNTVSLMTVHSAKGLEFDHVFVAGLEDGVFPHARSLEDGNGLSGDDVWKSMIADTAGSDSESPDFEYRDEPEKEDMESDELQEERRLMYVAITRARRSLNISTARKRMVNGQEKQMVASRFIREIPKHRIHHAQELWAPSAAAGFNKNNFHTTSVAEQEDLKQVAAKPNRFLRHRLR